VIEPGNDAAMMPNLIGGDRIGCVTFYVVRFYVVRGGAAGGAKMLRLSERWQLAKEISTKQYTCRRVPLAQRNAPQVGIFRARNRLKPTAWLR
jgi:hypothetical protein